MKSKFVNFQKQCMFLHSLKKKQMSLGVHVKHLHHTPHRIDLVFIVGVPVWLCNIKATEEKKKTSP